MAIRDYGVYVMGLDGHVLQRSEQPAAESRLDDVQRVAARDDPRRLNGEFERGNWPFYRIRIGLDTGGAVAGNIGWEDRMTMRSW
jgi:class 3 adenylate cyclase